MKNKLHLFLVITFSCLFLVALCGCAKEINWKKELSDSGYLYMKDSVSIAVNFRLNPRTTLENNGYELDHDTLRFPCFLLMEFEKRGYRQNFMDTAAIGYRLEKLPSVIRLIECDSNPIYPDTLYFRKDRKALNKQFGLYFEDFDGYEDKVLKIDSNFILSVEFPVKPIESRMNAAYSVKLQSKDSIYAAAYLNRLIKRRYQTELVTGISCYFGGAADKAILLYNGSLFNYEPYQPLPVSHFLSSYFNHERLDKYPLRPPTAWYWNFPERLRAKYRTAIPPVPDHN